jgi:DNA repair protein RadA/Sms
MSAGGAALPIAAVDTTSTDLLASGQEEFDRVVGGGLVPGSVVLLAGEPGVGKSTLLLDVAHRLAERGARALILTAEESAAQVRLRAGRIGALHPELFLAAEADVTSVPRRVAEVRPRVLVVDSVQTMADPQCDGLPGGVTQVRQVAATLAQVARREAIATIIVGHVTKDGSVAGPRTLEHLVDVVLTFDGDPQSTLRLLRASKNRYGTTEEVGCFEMAAEGLAGIRDPAGRFLSDRSAPVMGTCTTVLLDGRRALPVEVQALVGAGGDAPPRRATTGLDPARLAVLLAVVERRGGIPLGRRDVYTATVGGARVSEPAADLATALAVAGAATDRLVAPATVAVGELALTGEVRPVSGLPRRLAEAARLDFRDALVPPGTAPVPGMRLHPVADLAAALQLLELRNERLAVLAG